MPDSKLILNLSMIGPSPTGIEIYARHCARYLESHLKCTVISSHYEPASDVSSIRSPESIAIGGGRFASLRRILYNIWKFPKINDLIYTPTHHGVLSSNNQIITIHDLISLRYPYQHKLQYLYFKYLIPKLIKRSKGIFTVSETSKSEISEYYHIDKTSIYVVPSGVDLERFCPLKEVMGKEKYLLVVGASYPHKNIDELIANWPFWKGRYKLKIASSKGKYRLFLQSLVEKYGLVGDVEFLGYVSNGQLVNLYQNCAALVFPSLWEGFGMPPLEAMACGRPVIVSDIPVHREILSDVPIYITPGNKESWHNAFEILNDEQKIAAKIMKGLEFVKQYSWERSGEKLLEALFSVESKLGRLKR